MIQFCLNYKKAPQNGAWGYLTFSTDNGELYSMVLDYVQNCVDAVKWRNRVEEIQGDFIGPKTSDSWEGVAPLDDYI